MLLGACGFQPIYGAGESFNGAVVAELAAVRIAPIADRVGQIVHNDLLDRLTPFGAPAQPRYELAVRLAESKEGLAIQIDNTITRFNLTLTATYRLEEAASRAVVAAGSIRATAAYNVLRSDFANVIAERDAQRRAAREVAEELMTRLAVHFAGARSAVGA